MLAIVIGTAIYFYVHMLIETTVDIDLKVNVLINTSLVESKDIPDSGVVSEFEVANDSKNLTVMTKFKGPNNKINLLKNDPPTVEIIVGSNKEAIEAGKITVNLDISHIKNLPQNMLLSDIDVEFMSTVDIDIVEMIEKKVGVKVDYDFSDSTLVNVKGVSYTTPSSVTVKGPRELIKDMKFIKTKTIKNIIQNVTQTDIKDEVELLEFYNNTPIICTPKVLSLVKLDISDWDEKIVISQVPIKYMALSNGREVIYNKQKYVTLTVRGSPTLEDGTQLRKLTVDKFRVFVSIEMEENKMIERRVMVWTDLKGVKIDVEPKFVKVMVKKSQ